MAQKNDTPALIISLIITVALLGGGFWLVTRNLNLFGSSNSGSVTNPESSTTTTPTGSGVRVSERLSGGDRLLLTESPSTQKQAGIDAMASRNYAAAVSNFQAALQTDRNDPESLIYLNNAQIGDQTAYTIAVSVPTATAANSALEILRGVAQAQDEINLAGGINGIPLKVLIVSDDNDPEVAKQVANALVKDNSVLAVIGHFGSDATLAAAPVYEQAGLVMISPTSTSIGLSGVGQYVFRTVPSDRFTANTLFGYMSNTLGLQNAAVFFNSESSYSQSLKDQFTTAVYGGGGQVVGEFDLAAPSFDAGNALDQARQQGAQVLVLLSNTATLDQALQVVAVNRRELPLLGGDSLYNPKLLQVGGTNVEGMVVAVPWILASNPNTPFVQNSRRLWGGDVNWRTAMAYDAAQVLIAGLAQQSTRSGLEQALHSPNFAIDGATGQVRFLPSGDRNQAMQLVIVEPGNRSGYGYDFVPAP